ncbi:MAG: hypothetical protein ACYC2U_06370 [Candidatus Amoebophilus sp.]
MMKHFTIFLIVLLLLIPGSSEAGRLSKQARSKLKSGVKSILKLAPGGGTVTSLLDQIGGNNMEEKVDRIDKRQKNSLDRIREIAYQAMETKKKVEEMYYFKKQSLSQAQWLASGLGKAKPTKLLGALVQKQLQIPLNPAEYIPSTPATMKLKEQLDFDLSLENSLVRQGRSFLSNTRSDLLASNLLETNPQQFKKEYAKAEAYEAILQESLTARDQTMIKIYKEELEQLEKEIKLLEEAKNKEGLTVSDVMQTEIAIDNKKEKAQTLREKITAFIKGNLQLSNEEKQKLAALKATEEANELTDFLTKEKKRMKQKYGHLWKF